MTSKHPALENLLEQTEEILFQLGAPWFVRRYLMRALLSVRSA